MNAYARLRKSLFTGTEKKSKYLRAVYDFEVCALTYDFACFVIFAEIEATSRKFEGFEIVLVPRHRPELIESEYSKIVTDDEKEWRVRSLLVPIAHLSPMCKGILCASDRQLALDYIRGNPVFPDLYGQTSLRGLDYPAFYKKARTGNFTGLNATRHARDVVAQWLRARNISGDIVVITLRAYGHDPARNSNIPEWEKLSEHIVTLGLTPVVIPDVGMATEDLSRYQFFGYFFSEACWNIDLRMAIYEVAFVNLFVNNGPAQLAMLSRKCRYLLFKVSAESSPLATIEYLRSMGLEPYKSLPFALPWQRFVWEDDNYLVMARHLNEFVAEFRGQVRRQ